MAALTLPIPAVASAASMAIEYAFVEPDMGHGQHPGVVGGATKVFEFLVSGGDHRRSRPPFPLVPFPHGGVQLTGSRTMP